MAEFDDNLEEREVTESLVASIKSFINDRCCLTLDSEGYTEILHGRFIAFVQQWPAVLVRDVTPGKELLCRKRIVPLEVIRDMCISQSNKKCKQCDVYKDLVEQFEKEQEAEKPEEESKGQEEETDDA